jgi:hypothetical protein
MTPRARQQASRRGAATVELALVVPLLVSILMFSMYLSDIVRAKLKLQEASRYIAWEMTSYTLSDYATANHPRAFDTALRATRQEAEERYKDLDSLEPDVTFGFMLRSEPVEVDIQNQTVAGLDLSQVFLEGPEGAGEEVAGAVGKTLGSLLDSFRFNTQGQVRVEVSSRLTHRMMPRQYLQKEQGGFFAVDNWGGRDLSDMRVKNRFSLIANGWHLPDGADARVKPMRAGVHDGGSKHGLFLQVDRMKLPGVGNSLDKVGLEQLGQVAHFILPDFQGPFVVSHNYRPGDAQGCNKDKHGAHPGLNNLASYPGLDDDEQRCFDTVPFRDTQAYDSSLYRSIFMARGEHFMGCKNPQADTPNMPHADPSTSTDKNRKKVTCE